MRTFPRQPLAMSTRVLRCVDSVAVVATFCATVLLVKSCVCVTEEDDEVLDTKQLTDYYSKSLL